MPIQSGHSLQGSQFLANLQLTALAKTLAALVFPVPLGPVKRYAWDTLS
jgi:hypothetical protein